MYTGCNVAYPISIYSHTLCNNILLYGLVMQESHGITIMVSHNDVQADLGFSCVLVNIHGKNTCL